MNEYEIKIQQLEDEIGKYKEFHRWMFSADFNCNDFYGWACAASTEVISTDFKWVFDHYKKHGNGGIMASLAYIQNTEPIEPHLTDGFNEAMKELMDRGQVVFGDIDGESYEYSTAGPYRKIWTIEQFREYFKK